MWWKNIIELTRECEGELSSLNCIDLLILFVRPMTNYKNGNTRMGRIFMVLESKSSSQRTISILLQILHIRILFLLELKSCNFQAECLHSNVYAFKIAPTYFFRLNICYSSLTAYLDKFREGNHIYSQSPFCQTRQSRLFQCPLLK